MKVLITGSRSWPDKSIVRRALDDVGFRFGFEDMIVVHGHCPAGADAQADEWASDNADLGVQVERYPAKWDLLGKKAGPVRNQEMVDKGADLVLAFMQPGSKGTKHCMSAAKDAGLPVLAYYLTPDEDAPEFYELEFKTYNDADKMLNLPPNKEDDE